MASVPLNANICTFLTQQPASAWNSACCSILSNPPSDRCDPTEIHIKNIDTNAGHVDVRGE